MDNKELFWNRVKSTVKERGLTNKYLAEVTGISHNTLSGWISKNVVPDAILSHKIATALGVTVEYLVTGEKPVSKADSAVADILDALKRNGY